MAAAPPAAAALTIAASGPMALATSLEPWAKHSIAAETMSGMVNSRPTSSRVFAMVFPAAATIGRTMK